MSNSVIKREKYNDAIRSIKFEFFSTKRVQRPMTEYILSVVVVKLSLRLEQF